MILGREKSSVYAWLFRAKPWLIYFLQHKLSTKERKKEKKKNILTRDLRDEFPCNWNPA
jgi:hypothetical protein